MFVCSLLQNFLLGCFWGFFFWWEEGWRAWLVIGFVSEELQPLRVAAICLESLFICNRKQTNQQKKSLATAAALAPSGGWGNLESPRPSQPGKVKCKCSALKEALTYRFFRKALLLQQPCNSPTTMLLLLRWGFSSPTGRRSVGLARTG